MKKSLIILMTTLIAMMLFVSCSNSSKEPEKNVIGTIGPAGGIIFYDAGSVQEDSYYYYDSSNSLVYGSYRWRYLEAAPEDITVVSDSSTTNNFKFGFYRRTGGPENFSNNTTKNVKIGYGRYNTTGLVMLNGNEAYTTADGNSTTKNYAAKLCMGYKNNNTGEGYKEYTDWFLPSKEEFEAMSKLQSIVDTLDSSSTYWTSSECEGGSTCWAFSVSSNKAENNCSRGNDYRIRAVHAIESLDN